MIAGWIFLALVTGVFVHAAVAAAFGRAPAWTRKISAITLGIFWVVSAVVLVVRFAAGLDVVTAMSDGFPWGVWIGLLQSGVALSAGGFVIAATVHVFHIKRFESILRPMVLTAFLGYSFVAMTLFIEVGRPYRLWHPLVMWQHASIMFEVAWCVTLYISVLAVEFSPAIFEKAGLHGVVRGLHVIAIPLVIAGVILSTLHQSSMGSMFLVMPQKIHPLWFSPLLPVFFLISSVAVGLCMTVVESFFSHRVFGRGLRMDLLNDIGRAAAVVLWIYFLVKVVDLLARGSWSAAEGYPWLAVSYAVEVIGGIAVPAVLLSFHRWRSHLKTMVGASLAASGGVVLNRLNVSWFGMAPFASVSYFPSWMELAISLFLLTVVLVAFGVAVKFLPVFPAATGRIEESASA